MLEYLKKEANKTLTENGALTYKSTESDCLDLFATIGALRSADEERILGLFLRAYAENADLALKTLFYGRDARGGLGERRVFRIILKYLAFAEKKTVLKNLPYVAEFGRYDDLLVLLDTPCEKEVIELIREQLEADLEALSAQKEISLLAKWLPSVNASDKEAVRMAQKLSKALGMTDREYRKMLSKLRAALRLTENSLREKDYTFDYEKQPSKAMYKYRGAFIRNDHDRYMNFLDDVAAGKTKLHTDNVMPYEILAPYMDYYNPRFDLDLYEDARKAADVTWNALPDYTADSNAVVVADVSGSMYVPDDPNSVKPINVAVSLAIYFAERCKGAFHNHFITFTTRPELVELKGRDIVEKVRCCRDADWGGSTNLAKVFDLLLDTARKNHLPQEELPSTLYIISDMEFDSCMEGADMTNFEYAKKAFEANGYTLPNVVFWNVNSHRRQQPVTKDERGVALVSGCTPRIFAQVMPDGVGALTPYEYMLEVLGGERYEKISA